MAQGSRTVGGEKHRGSHLTVRPGLFEHLRSTYGSAISKARVSCGPNLLIPPGTSYLDLVALLAQCDGGCETAYTASRDEHA